ncbi:nesp016 [Neophasia sp. alphabaculovirus]|nr:nesp016 [Neophasia sp. alphabaculovirus]
MIAALITCVRTNCACIVTLITSLILTRRLACPLCIILAVMAARRACIVIYYCNVVKIKQNIY